MQPRRSEYAALLAWTMAASVLQLFALAVLASNIIEELGVSRWQIGILGAANTLVGALTAPTFGRFVDRAGPRAAILVVLIWSAVGLLLTAAASTFALLLVGSMVSGVPQGAGNPATNKLIAEEVAYGQRGALTGIKQSGVQLAIFLAGITLPGAAGAFGWRWAVAASGLFTLVFAAVAAVRFPLSGSHPRMTADTASGSDVVARSTLESFVYRITVYSFLMGLVASGMTRFLPLFGEEVLGYSDTASGAIYAVSAALGLAARLWWGRLVEHSVATAPSLVLLAAGSAATAALLLVAEPVGPWVLWPIAVGVGFFVSAWNVVTMFALITEVPTHQSGRASGVVLFGFLLGLSIGPPVVGWSIDQTNSYDSAWIAVGVLSLLSALVMLRPARAHRADTGHHLAH